MIKKLSIFYNIDKLSFKAYYYLSYKWKVKYIINYSFVTVYMYLFVFIYISNKGNKHCLKRKYI